MLSRKALQISPSPTLAVDAKAKQMKSEGIDVISFGAGEPDFDTPRHIKEAGIAAINQGFTKYTPASGLFELKEAICRKLLNDQGLYYQPDQIVVSNGAKHALDNVFASLLNEGDEVIIPAPYWVSYPELVKLNNGIPVIVTTKRENNFKLTGHELKRALTSRTKALILNSPNNPTGQVFSKEELESIAALILEAGLYLISDEIYEKLVYDAHQHISSASLGEKIKESTIIVNGLSKTYAMTGWRIGYTASNAGLAAAMANIQSHTASNPNSMAQKAALTALTAPQDCVEKMRRAFAGRRDYLLKRINKMPYLSYLPPGGTFYLFVNVKETFSKKFRGIKVENIDNLTALLLDQFCVALVSGKGFGAPEFVRLSYAISRENISTGLSRIEAFLQELV